MKGLWSKGNVLHEMEDKVSNFKSVRSNGESPNEQCRLAL